MNVGSLFSGIGGIDLGLERAGMRVLWQCEADPYCRAVLRKHWPDVPCYGDVLEIGGSIAAYQRDDGSWYGAVPRVDLLCGGFPCQPFSYAGAKRGTADERWLWPEFARVVGLLRPRYVVVENVPGLLAGHGGMGNVLGDLAALGYDAEWDCIPASALGANHRRDRVWVIAYPDSDTRRLTLSGKRNSRQERPEQQAPQGRHADGLRSDVADAECSRLEGHGQRPVRTRATSGGDPRIVQDPDLGTVQPRRIWGRAPQTGSAEWWAAEPDVGRVAHGVPSRLDRLAALGNAVVPQVAEWIGRRILEAEASMTPVLASAGKEGA